MNVDTVIRDSFAKTNTGDEEGDTVHTPVQYSHRLSDISGENSGVDRHKGTPD